MFFSSRLPSNYPHTDYRSCNYKGDWTKHFVNNYVDSIASHGIEETQKEFSNFKSEHLPQYLYKFMPPTIHSLNSILQGTVHLSSPHIFNDPFDSYLCVNTEAFIKTYVLAELKNQGHVKDIEKCKESITTKEYWAIYHSRCEGENRNYRNRNFWSTFYEITNSKSESFSKLCNKIYYDAQKIGDLKMKFLRNNMYRISCFSHFSEEDKLMQNTTMWSHYADEHRGFCVKYSMDFIDCKFQNLLLCSLFPVKYTSRTEKITATQLLKLKEKNGELFVDDVVKKKIIKSLLSKSGFWNYEKEWRLILSEKECCLLYENNIPFSEIEAIYLGCRIDKSIEQLLIKIGGKHDINIFKTKQSDNKYTLYNSQVDTKRLVSDEYFYKFKKVNSINDEMERMRMLRYID